MKISSEILILFPFLIFATPRPQIISETECMNRIKKVLKYPALAGAKTLETLPHQKCATLLMGHVQKYRSSFKTENQMVLSKLLAGRPNYNNHYKSQGGNFKIWWTNTGLNAPSLSDTNNNTVPDYVESCGQIFDSVWNFQIVGLGFSPPPRDSDFNPPLSFGGDSRYDIYLQEMEAYAYTWADYEAGTSYQSTSYIIMENDYAGFPGYQNNPLDAVRVTAAHEFFHAIQFGYNNSTIGSGESFYENSAVWMEEIEYTAINDYYQYVNGLNGFFGTFPKTSLTTANFDFEYGAGIWPIFISERYGHAWMKSFWDQAKSEALNWKSNYTTLQVIFGNLATDWKKEFAEFSVWDYFIDTKADTSRFFPEGNFYYGLSLQKQVAGLEDSVETVIQGTLPYLTAQYVEFIVNRNVGGNIQITCSAAPGLTYRILSYDSLNAFSSAVELLDSGTFIQKDWQDYSRYTVVPIFYLSQGTQPYTITARLDSPTFFLKPKSQSLKQILFSSFPNPFKQSTNISITVPASVMLPSALSLKIFNSSGLKVFEKKLFNPADFSTSAPSLQFKWNPVNLPAGIYYAQLTGFKQIYSVPLLYLK